MMINVINEEKKARRAPDRNEFNRLILSTVNGHSVLVLIKGEDIRGVIKSVHVRLCVYESCGKLLNHFIDIFMWAFLFFVLVVVVACRLSWKRAETFKLIIINQ